MLLDLIWCLYTSKKIFFFVAKMLNELSSTWTYFLFYFSAFNQMGYRLSPPFCQLVVRKYDITGMQRLGLDNFIQVSRAFLSQ